MLQVGSVGHISVSPLVQARAHKLRHVFQRIVVCHRARHSARNAIHQQQDGNGRLLVTVFGPGEEQEVQLHLWVTWFCLASATTWVICSTRGDTDGTPTSKWQLQWFMLRDIVISSVGSLGPRFTREARSSIGSSGSCFLMSCPAVNKASVSAAGINDISSGAISSFSVDFDTSRSGSTVRKNCPRPGVHQSECTLHS